jgi:hypothetical protein
MPNYSLALTSGTILVSPYQYATDQDGNHIIDEDGNYIITESSFDVALSLLATRSLSIASGALTLTGTHVGIGANWVFTLASGALALTGTGVSLEGRLRLNLASGVVTLAGTKVDLVYVAGPIYVYYDLTITSGHYVTTGTAIQLSRSLGLLASKRPSIMSQTTKHTFH